MSYPYQYWEGIIISISYLYPYLLDTQKYLNYINSVGKTRLFVYLKWQDTSLLLMKVVNNWIEESRGSQLWWESIANQKLMWNFEALSSKFQEKFEGNWIWQLILWIVKDMILYHWYDSFAQYIHVTYQNVHQDIISYHISQFEI